MRDVPDLDSLKERIAGIDEAIRPIATRHVDVTLLDQLPSGPHPLDEAGVRGEADSVMGDLIDGYLVRDESWRSEARELFRQFRWFAWGVTVGAAPTSEPELLRQLVHFSLSDQGMDPRDARLWLDRLLAEAAEAGIASGAALGEVAALSSDEDRYGWGPTRTWLERAARG